MDEQIIATYCLCDDLLKAIHQHADPQCKMRDAEVMTTALTAAFSTGHFHKFCGHKHLRGWLIVYSLESATHPEGACHERQPPPISCHT
jgi:hypothetical protein